MNVYPLLLSGADGKTVTAENWPQRRSELYQAIVPHEYGGMPPPHVRTETIQRAQGAARPWSGVAYHTNEIRVVFPGDRDLSFTLSLWIPPGNGPFPVVLSGDGCWRGFNDNIVRQVLDRGHIAASFDRTAVAADNPQRYRETGLYRLFPDAVFGVISAWAWAYHRCVDALASMEKVRADAIAVTGHSRGGKTVLLAGATDERIAVTNPNDSGCGGSSLNRLKCEGSEVIDSFFGSGNIFWFGQGFADYRHRDGDLPYDQHFLHALVAPRLLLVNEAYEDKWASPPGSYAACLAAKEVYQMLGFPDRIGWAVREGGHAHQPEDFCALLDFMDRHLCGKEVTRNFQRTLFPGIERILT